MTALRGQQGVAGFYRAFYNWSQLNNVIHTRRYTPEAASTAAAPTSDTRSRYIRRLPWYTPSEKIHVLAANNNAILNQIQEQTGVKVAFSGIPKPGSRRYRVFLTGEEDALEECRNLILSLTSEPEDKTIKEALSGSTASPRLAEAARPLNISYTSNTSNTPRTHEDAAPAPELLRSQFKNIMRHTSSNITLLTTDVLSGSGAPTPSSALKHWNLRGMTISSLTPVTLSPEPIVSFNIKAPSRTLDAILASKLLTATFLTPTSAGAKIAHAFTTPCQDPSTPFRKLEDAELVTVFGNQRSGPKLGGEGVGARFRCVLVKWVKVADHVVCFARVSHVWTPELKGVRETFLGYSGGGYRGVHGEALDGVLVEKVEDVFDIESGDKSEIRSRDVSGDGEKADLTEAYFRAAEEGSEDAHTKESPKTSEK